MTPTTRPYVAPRSGRCAGCGGRYAAGDLIVTVATGGYVSETRHAESCEPAAGTDKLRADLTDALSDAAVAYRRRPGDGDEP